MKTSLILLAASLAAASGFQTMTYFGYSVLRFTNPEISNAVIDSGVCRYMLSHSGPLECAVDRSGVQIVQAYGWPYEIVMSDLSRALEDHRTDVMHARMARNSDFHQSYHTLDELYDRWLSDWPSSFGSYFVSSEVIGSSVLGKDLHAFHFGGSDAGDRKVYLQGGLHAREWVSPASLTYALEKMVSEAQNGDALAQYRLNCVDWVVVMMANPDGYEFTWDSDRMWRKNRQYNDGSSCRGVDLNRNWDEHWGYSGVSSDPCSEVYPGTAAFSEPETTSISNFLLSLAESAPFVAGLDFHSYGQLVLRPYGWDVPSVAGVPANDQELADLADEMVGAIYSSTGVTYTNQRAGEFYPASGATDDWMWSTITDQQISFTPELRDDYYYGFVLPSEYIDDTGEDVYAILTVLADNVCPAFVPPETETDNSSIPVCNSCGESCGACPGDSCEVSYDCFSGSCVAEDDHSVPCESVRRGLLFGGGSPAEGCECL